MVLSSIHRDKTETIQLRRAQIPFHILLIAYQHHHGNTLCIYSIYSFSHTVQRTVQHQT